LLENQNKQQDQMIGLNFSWRLTSKWMLEKAGCEGGG
jgi:hypothetical protein